ncbi:MAG: hypothetical protein Q9171_004181 [Xanthocarpia ochracea]
MDFQSWRKGGRRQSDPAFGGTLAPYLQSINRILRDEIHSSPPHLCIRNVAITQLYVLVSLIGTVTRNEQSAKASLRFFGLLIDSEDEDFINDPSFADKFIVLMRAGSAAGITRGFEVEIEVVELLFAVAAKLRHQPEVPPAWFRPSTDTDQDQSRLSTASISVSRLWEFPLVFMLLDYVHYDGKVGDFARTGHLYILESASRSSKLERWIIDSDLATILASGLGALYSQLSSKIALSHANESVPPVLAFSKVTYPDHADDEPMFSTTVQAHLATFLSYLTFWQDMLERCPSIDIKATLLDHFDFLFLRPVLYPSLVESSDIDCGSSVAVMTYLRSILENITHTDIIRVLLHYMFGSPSEQKQDTESSRPTALARRRKSETLITSNANRSDDTSPDLLTLTDILQGYLASRNQRTVTASLRLLATILRSWHDIASTKLFRLQLATTTGEQRSIEIHGRYLDVLYSMAEDILDDEGLKTYYKSHLLDAQVVIEMHACSRRQLILAKTNSTEALSLHKYRGSVQQNRIKPEDPLFVCLLSLLENFLTNDTEINLSLSETLAALASCSETALDGWLLGPARNYVYPPGNEDTAETMDDWTCNGQVSGNSPMTVSPILACFSTLVDQIEKLRVDIQDFDIHLSERRHVFQLAEEIDNAAVDIPVPKSQDWEDSQKSKPRDSAATGAISERLNASRNASRASSHRGRQQSSTEHHQAPPKSLVGSLNQNRLSLSGSPFKIIERSYSSSPLRRTSTSSRTSGGLPSPRGLSDMLHRKIRVGPNTGRRRHLREGIDSESSSLRSVRSTAEPVIKETRDVTLSHLLTNVIILQEFILELAAIIQIRASLFSEVSLD